MGSVVSSVFGASLILGTKSLSLCRFDFDFYFFILYLCPSTYYNGSANTKLVQYPFKYLQKKLFYLERVNSYTLYKYVSRVADLLKPI